MSTVHEDIVKLVANNLKCSICFELFSEPVTLSCGHSYCLNCIQGHLIRGQRTCPQCRSQLHAKPHLKKNVTLSNILDLQEAGGREMWNQVSTRTDQCFSYQTEKMTEDVLVRRLEILKLEIKRLETLRTELNTEHQLGKISPDPDSDAHMVSEVLFEDGAAVAGLSEDCGLAYCATAEMTCSQPAEFAVLSFSSAMGHRRLAFFPESHRLVVCLTRSQVIQNIRFDACQWMADQEFSTGRHYWDVDVSRCSGWAAGVAYPNLVRNEKLGRGPSSWCIERSSGRLSTWHNNVETLLKQDCPVSVRVLLDMDSSCLSFWNLLDGLVELCSIWTGFTGPVRPVFWLFGTQQGNSLTFPAEVSQQVN